MLDFRDLRLARAENRLWCDHCDARIAPQAEFEVAVTPGGRLAVHPRCLAPAVARYRPFDSTPDEFHPGLKWAE